MDNRPTQTFTTPGNHTIVLKTYLTGKESKEIRGIIFGELKMTMSVGEGQKPELKEVPADFVLRQEEKSVEMLVVSVDGVTENVRGLLEDLPESDYNAVIEEIKKIQVPFPTTK